MPLWWWFVFVWIVLSWKCRMWTPVCMELRIIIIIIHGFVSVHWCVCMNEMSPRPVPVQILMSLVNRCPCTSAITVHFFYWLIFHDEEDAAVWARSRETVTVEVCIQTISCSCLRGSYARHVWNLIFIGPHTPWLGLCHNAHTHVCTCTLTHMHTHTRTHPS